MVDAPFSDVEPKGTEGDMMRLGVFFDGFSTTAEMLDVVPPGRGGGGGEPVVRPAHGVSRRHRVGDGGG